jgi:hypothetical protein
MEKELLALFDEMIKMERKVAALYLLYMELFPEDSGFWHEMWEDEEMHAAIIHSAKDYFFEDGLFPIEALDLDRARLEKMNSSLELTISQYRNEHPLKKTALLRSLEVEHSSGEYCYNSALETQAQTPGINLLRDLTGKGCKHEKKIRELMMQYGVKEI